MQFVRVFYKIEKRINFILGLLSVAVHSSLNGQRRATKKEISVHTNLPARMSALEILWSTNTEIWFLLEHSSLHSYTAHLHKGLVFSAQAELHPLLLQIRQSY